MLLLMLHVRKIKSYLSGILRFRYPKFVADYYQEILIGNQKTFNQKILNRMLNDRNPIFKIYADKLEMRKQICDLGLAKLLPELYWHGDNTEKLIPELLIPRTAILKPSRGSGAAIIIKNQSIILEERNLNPWTNPWGVFVYDLHNLKISEISHISNQWLRFNYHCRVDSFFEWAFADARSELILEELMLDSDGRIPRDYKLFMFYGECKLIQIDYDRFGFHTRAFFSPEWEKLDLKCLYPLATNEELKPPEFDLMLAYATLIAGQIDFIRIDFYITSQGIKFGECSPYPGGGIDKFEPPSMNSTLATYWK